MAPEGNTHHCPKCPGSKGQSRKSDNGTCCPQHRTVCKGKYGINHAAFVHLKDEHCVKCETITKAIRAQDEKDRAKESKRNAKKEEKKAFTREPPKDRKDRKEPTQQDLAQQKARQDAFDEEQKKKKAKENYAAAKAKASSKASESRGGSPSKRGESPSKKGGNRAAGGSYRQNQASIIGQRERGRAGQQVEIYSRYHRQGQGSYDDARYYDRNRPRESRPSGYGQQFHEEDRARARVREYRRPDQERRTPGYGTYGGGHYIDPYPEERQRSPERRSLSTRSPERRPVISRSPERRPITRSPERRPTASRNPERRPISTRYPSDRASAGRRDRELDYYSESMTMGGGAGYGYGGGYGYRGYGSY